MAWDASRNGSRTSSRQPSRAAPGAVSRSHPMSSGTLEPSSSKEDLEEWILRNESVLSVDAKLILREMNSADRHAVLAAGDLPPDTTSPVWSITERISKAKVERTSAPPQRKSNSLGETAAKRPKLMQENKWNDQRSRNQRAAEEGRAVYVRGIPPLWTSKDLKQFFSDLGEVESVNLLPQKANQRCLAGFVNFATHEEALDAAKACDQIEVQDARFEKFELACSIKGALGAKVDIVSGFTELSRARQERRALYVSQLPGWVEDWELRELFEPLGSMESLRRLPGGDKNLAVFIIMDNVEAAQQAVETIDGYEMHGHTISVSFPKQPKRTRGFDADTTVELSGFPADATESDINAIFAASRQAQAVKLLGPGRCHVVMESKEDAHAVIEELNNFEFIPGHTLQAVLARDPGDSNIVESLKDLTSGQSVSQAGSQDWERRDSSLWEAGRQQSPQREDSSRWEPDRWEPPAARPRSPERPSFGRPVGQPKARGLALPVPKARGRPRPKPTCAPHLQEQRAPKRKMDDVADEWSEF
eukprot:TRINITY_DN76036_c0_g1_i1.p1 TRINITY_DN76036_c0_g1~~TRINITY_DN76036_c0_g1_i1.p1  ORF type:complete len:543 (+),score=99.38 TRINITY_DN76036_c0_g1_i1:33-1631(+)